MRISNAAKLLALYTAVGDYLNGLKEYSRSRTQEGWDKPQEALVRIIKIYQELKEQDKEKNSN